VSEITGNENDFYFKSGKENKKYFSFRDIIELYM